MSIAGRVSKEVTTKLHTVYALTNAGIIRPQRPDRAARMALALLLWGPTPAAGYAGNAARYPNETAIVDELGTLSFQDVHERTNGLAHAWAEDGIGVGDGVAIMCRNHRGFIDAYVACSKLGANALFLNTAFSGPQITDVVRREEPKALVFDHEFANLVKDAGKRRRRYVAWHDPDDGKAKDPRIEDLIDGADASDLSPPPDRGKAIILTSGTTGTPKGAARSQPRSLEPAAALLAMIPLRARERTMIAAPMFHSWGLVHFTLGMTLSTTLVLQRRFDPDAVLRAIE